MKLPALHFYVGDWRKDIGVQSLSYHDRGVWIELLCLMFESEQRGRLVLNGKAMSDDTVARLLGLDPQVCKKSIQVLLESGVASRCPATGALMSRRMVRDEELRKLRQECGKLGGNPQLVKQSSNLVNQNSTTYHNPRDNLVHEDEDEDEKVKGRECRGKPKPEPGIADVTIPQNLRTPAFEAKWLQWVEYRRALKRCKDWVALFQEQLDWLGTFPEPTATAMLAQSMRNGWQGLFELKIETNARTNKPNPRNAGFASDAAKQGALIAEALRGKKA